MQGGDAFAPGEGKMVAWQPPLQTELKEHPLSESITVAQKAIPFPHEQDFYQSDKLKHFQ